MQSIIIIILIDLVGRMAVGVQALLSSRISQRLGVFESIFIVHLGAKIAVCFLISLTSQYIYGSSASIDFAVE